ncbi:trimeric intracellular cation channel family protein [Corynebacterium pilosum]|nr:trimeric intracellular cation channel family protein [Corynebacterium pilosum]
MEDLAPNVQALYRFLDLAGVFLMGIVGGTIARKRNFDIIGFLFLSLFTALGGGILRDMMIGQGTVAAMANEEYLILAFGGALVAALTDFKGKLWELFKFHADAIVLGFWAVTGCVKALSYNLPVVACVFMGVVTAVGGGMVRDVVIGSVPSIFTSQQLYAVPALVSAVSMVIFDAFGLNLLGMAISPLFAIALAMLSYWRGWYIPARSDFAPVNMTASQVRELMKLAEDRGRRVGRRIEPSRVRSWRHEQMEKDLQRRKRRQGDEETPQSADQAEKTAAEERQEFEDALDVLLDDDARTDSDEQWTLGTKDSNDEDTDATEDSAKHKD